MHIELLTELKERKLNIWSDFLVKSGLQPDTDFDLVALLWDGDNLIATGARLGNLLKCIAVDETRQGEGLTATLITALKNDAFSNNIYHLFLCTKPQNKGIFTDLFFYPVAETDDVLLMESKKDGISNFLQSLKNNKTTGINGCVVMNCNPFTLGHRYLIETASRECDNLFVFVVSEDKSRFSYKDRIEMVKEGTKDIPNVSVLPTGPYLISSATFPTYFLKNRDNIAEIKCLLDIKIFTEYYAPHFNIRTRYVGCEPFSLATEQYNIALKKFLPANGIEVKELPRFEIKNKPVSASRVRELIESGNIREASALVPDTTYNYLVNKGLI